MGQVSGGRIPGLSSVPKIGACGEGVGEVRYRGRVGVRGEASRIVFVL